MPDDLASWNDGETKSGTLQFVRSVTQPGASFVPLEERIATFDNDGTLWCEKPMPMQLDFIQRRLSAMAEAQPELRERQPWKAAHERDYAWLGAVVDKQGHGGSITHTAAPEYLDDGPQKPIPIWSRTGRRPLFAGGNSNGDVPILEFAHREDKPTLQLLVLHDDADREFAARLAPSRRSSMPGRMAGRSPA
jgi:hypothetical protein